MKKIISRRKNEFAGLVFSLPIIIGLIIFLIPIVINGIGFAFSNVDISNGLKMSYDGLKNFIYILRVDANYSQLVIDDIKNLMTSLPIIIIFSLFVAVLLNSAVIGRTAFRAIFFLPVIACTGIISVLDANNVLMSAMTTSMQQKNTGLLTSMSDISLMLQSINLSPTLINIVSSAANNIFEIVTRSGVQILICLAGIQSITPSIYESAEVEGASSWEIFWKITLPMVCPMILACVLYTFVESITRDNTELILYIKNTGFTKSEFGYSAAMSWFHYVILVIILGLMAVILYAVFRISRKKEYT